MARVLVTRPLPPDWLSPLLDAGHDPEWLEPEPLPHARIVDAAAEYDALICTITDTIDDAVFSAGSARLRVVGNIGVGYDNIDLTAAARFGISVCNTPGVLDETTADLAFLLLLAASRRASDAEVTLRAGEWDGFRIDAFLGNDVHGATLGIVGFGRIGQAVARRAAGFGMNVLHHSRRDTGLPGYVADLDDLLARADAISLHVPLSVRTRGLMDERRLRLMRPHAVLVNTSRGPVVDEVALAIALERGVIFGAGLDVYEREPSVHPRLLAAPHTVLLPHIGSATEKTRRRMAQLACEGAVAVLAGRQPPNLVRPASTR
ncbi:MAG TPA: D-glycerate dehydrogenase [Frankiaceae bacterium]|nr:D-glycerate dehydrogenase [Frankiaceae bacterium]